LLDQCIAFYLGENLTYEKVLENLGAVDTDVFSQLLREILAQDTSQAIKILEDLIIRGRELGQFVTDFIWYLRNLLLISASDNPEEAVAVSRENLERMKEECQMVDTETLMRYIRIFSQLSNEIRYASQKRVLVEIALIKLCQPVMETNLDSLFDRVRVLEEKLNDPAFLARSQAPGRAGGEAEAFGGTDGNGYPRVPEAESPSMPKPAKAAPEDIQYVKKNWNSIIRETKGLLQQMLLESTPKYDGNTGEPVLYVEFRNFLAQTCIDNPENVEVLKQAIQKKIGKDLEVKMVLKKDEPGAGGGNLADISVDEMLRQNIHMDVTVENIEDDED